MVTRGRPAPPAGFALVAATGWLLVMAILAGVALPHPEAARRLARDAEYERILREYSVAISRFLWLNKRDPATLEELSNAVPRVLRRVYPDPASGRADTWVLVKDADGRVRPATTSPARSADGTPFADWRIDDARVLQKTVR